jgi:uncharacterized protein (TIGR02145 family)
MSKICRYQLCFWLGLALWTHTAALIKAGVSAAVICDPSASVYGSAPYQSLSSGLTDYRTLQTFASADCINVNEVTGTNYNLVGCLADERDGKYYEVRKFADGNCWLVDDLRFGGGGGGTGDYCANKSNVPQTYNSAVANNLNASGGLPYVGGCVDANAMDLDLGTSMPELFDNDPNYCTSGEGGDRCGYLYSWMAAIQNDNADAITSDPGSVTGLCPGTWHLPSATEFTTLLTQISDPNLFFSPTNQATSPWKGVYSGYPSFSSGSFYMTDQGQSNAYWTSTPAGSSTVRVLGTRNHTSPYAYVSDSISNYTKDSLAAIRCLISTSGNSGGGGGGGDSILPGGLQVFPRNSRLSFLGRLAGGGNVAGSSLLYLDQNANPATQVYSTSAKQVVAGDHLLIGDHIYLAGISSVPLPDNQLSLTSALIATDLGGTGAIYASQSGEIKLVFEAPVSGESGGEFVFLFPAVSAEATASDHLPDSGNFDFADASISCPENATSYGAWTAIATPATTAGVHIAGQAYHSFSCHFDGVSSDQPLEFIVRGLINPAPLYYEPGEEPAGRSTQSLDLAPILANQLDVNYNVKKVATNFASFTSGIQMSVQVLPYLSLSIKGFAAGEVTCFGVTAAHNLTANVTTTGANVPLGTISSSNFTDAAQQLEIKTNAEYGYVLTAIANDQLGLAGIDCSLTQNQTSCLPGYGSVTAAQPWTLDDGTGFGYALTLALGDTYLNGGLPNAVPAFTYRDHGWRSFPDHRHGQLPVSLLNNPRSSEEDRLNVCYRALADVTNRPGEYYNLLTYTVTATF